MDEATVITDEACPLGFRPVRIQPAEECGVEMGLAPMEGFMAAHQAAQAVSIYLHRFRLGLEHGHNRPPFQRLPARRGSR